MILNLTVQCYNGKTKFVSSCYSVGDLRSAKVPSRDSITTDDLQCPTFRISDRGERVNNCCHLASVG